MTDIYGKITDSELAVMNVLWDAGAPLPMTEIRSRLAESAGWESSTIKTLVQRLCAKGALAQEKRGVYYYTPCVTRDGYAGYAARSLIDRLYHGRARDLVAALVDTALDEADVAELRALLEEGHG